MNVSKLHDAIAELEEQKSVIDSAIEQIKSVIATLSGSNAEPPVVASGEAKESQQPIAISPVRNRARRGSHLRNAITALRQAGRPMHVDDIAGAISGMTGRKATRASVDGAISRDIRLNPETSRIVRVKPGIYGLRQISELRSWPS